VTVWIKPGVRADHRETAKRRQESGRRKAQTDLAEKRILAEARSGWEQGLVRPFRITNALDSRGLDGPEVDEACLAHEPDVDQWEAGTLYPTFEQLLALAKLTDYPAHYFVVPPTEADRLGWQFSTLHLHVSKAEREEMMREPDPVLAFTSEAIRAGVAS
jgi:hypothetical protein